MRGLSLRLGHCLPAGLTLGLILGLILGLTLGLLTGCGASPRPTRISAIGDSHTTGGRYLSEVHRELGVGGEAIGLVGQGARVISKRLPDVLNDQPTHVIVQAGVNDLASGRSLKHIRQHLTHMYRAIRGANAIVVAIPVLPWAASLERPRLRARKVALIAQTRALNDWMTAQHAAGLIDVLVDTSALGPEGGPLDPQLARTDGLHLTAAGQRVLGRKIADAIRAR
jgi:lysophospholipase L1-like esterase